MPTQVKPNAAATTQRFATFVDTLAKDKPVTPSAVTELKNATVQKADFDIAQKVIVQDWDKGSELFQALHQRRGDARALGPRFNDTTLAQKAVRLANDAKRTATAVPTRVERRFIYSPSAQSSRARPPA